MNEGPRRRRVREVETPPQRPRGEFPLLPLVVVVILLGIGAGALFHRLIAGQTTTTTSSTTTTVAASPTGAPTPEPTVSEQPSPEASSSSPASERPNGSPSPRATPHRIALTTPAPKPSPLPKASNAPRPTPKPVLVTPAPRVQPTASATPVPRTPEPRTPEPRTPKPSTPTPRPVKTPELTGSAAAGQVARNYLSALIRGDFAAANTALGRGPDATGFPEMDSIDHTTRITDLHTQSNGDGTYKVEAEIAGSKGTFYCTFVAAHNEAALYLSDHYCVRVQ